MFAPIMDLRALMGVGPRVADHTINCFSYDWDREIATTDPAYVKWTQWIFLVLHDTWCWYFLRFCELPDGCTRGRPSGKAAFPYPRE